MFSKSRSLGCCWPNSVVMFRIFTSRLLLFIDYYRFLLIVIDFVFSVTLISIDFRYHELILISGLNRLIPMISIDFRYRFLWLWSSAYMNKLLVCTFRDKSFWNKIHSSEPSGELCGQPLNWSFHVLVILLILTQFFARWNRKALALRMTNCFHAHMRF